ncbi:Ornithine cyclodeaminase family protein [Aspergillus mulundensis]|uniref:Ornithine cyclodeaminase family protein n=1 Tax=Aspergillus mulundensis TaxID=1810919 RepID=A0A3D8RYQ5_9EURO|nr:Ornithine cyclodeaminase family protein [Aspergillus mulundensis]RDW79172.1 Ornithine cyclodeaminase family protein [Aspergillus mulundensis]
MAGIRVLDNSTIHDILINLSRTETFDFLHILEQTLLDFTTTERHHQPAPSVANRPDGQNTLFRPFTSSSSIGTKIIVDPAPNSTGKRDPQGGVIVLCDEKGSPSGVLSAEEITGYRTSMNAMVPFCWRKHVENIVIFGAGVQALWHSRLILALRGDEVKSITYVSGDRARANKLRATISAENDARWKASCSLRHISSLAPEEEFQRELKSCLHEASCIFCTTPAKKPLFPPSYLPNVGSKGNSSSRLPFISAVGSWQPDMIELDPELLRLAIASNSSVTEKAGGAILVDDREFGLTNSGELIQSQVAAKDIVELGEIIALRKGRRNEISGLVAERGAEEMNWFISEGFVVYKSVGVSLTDLTVSEAVLELAKARGSKS